MIPPGKKILIVDDEPEATDLYTEIFDKVKAKTQVAANGFEAIQKCNNETFDLIVTDLNMPRMGGEDLVKEIRKNQLNVKSPILVISGFINEAVTENLTKVGKINFLRKPVGEKEILERSESILSAKKKAAKINVKFINPFLDATVSTIEQMCETKVEAGSPSLKNEMTYAIDISSVIGLVSSGFKGSISISFSKKVFLDMVNRMLDSEFDEINDENKDAASELLNIIFGMAKKELNQNGMDIDSAIPTVVHGEDLNVGHDPDLPTITIPFKSVDFGEFAVEITSTN